MGIANIVNEMLMYHLIAATTTNKQTNKQKP